MRKMIVLILVILVLGIAPVTAGGTAAKSSNPLVARLSSLNGQAFDVAFTQALIPIDEEAVEMAMTATLYADHSTLLRWNQDFVERKNKEIRKMLSLLQSMGARPSERRAGVATAHVKKLRTLRGAALEKTYLPLLAAQLDQSASLEHLATGKASRSEVRDFAKQSVRMDGQESTTLRSWLKQWYK